jgi:hypothetical protein
VQPGAAGGFTNDLEFTQVSQSVTVAPGQTTTESVICPNGYEGIEATYDLPDGLLLLGDDPEPITRVFLLDNTTNAPITGTVDLLCLADRTGPEVDYLGPVVNTATVGETNIDPNAANNTGTAAIRIDRAVGSANAPAPATPAPNAPAANTPATGPGSGSGSGGGSGSGSGGPSGASAPATHALVVAPSVVAGSLQVHARKASIVLSCGAHASCSGTVQLALRGTQHGKVVVLATGTYKLKAGTKQTIVLRFVKTAKSRVAAGLPKSLSLKLTPHGGKSKTTVVRQPASRRG